MSSIQQSMLFLFRHGSYGLDSMDIALTAAAFDQDVSLAFIGDGILQLLRNQNSEGIGLKNSSGVFPALELYEISKVFVEDDSMKAKGLSKDDLLIPVELISSKDLTSLMQSSDQVFNF